MKSRAALRLAVAAVSEPVARTVKPSQLDSIFRAARALSERALVARDMPRHPDLGDVIAGCDRDVEQAIADLMEALNG